MAAATRRVGAENSATRAAIIDAAEALMREEGYAAISTRKVATRAGLKPSLVHYYFPATEDLLLALFRKGADQSDVMIEQALASPEPLKAMWNFFADASRTRLALEFMALANHRKEIQAEIAQHSEKMRAYQVEAFERLLGDRLAGPGGCPPAGLSLILAGIGRALVMEGGLGVTAGHDEARKFVEAWLDTLTRD